jgi:hypothetical protein
VVARIEAGTRAVRSAGWAGWGIHMRVGAWQGRIMAVDEVLLVARLEVDLGRVDSALCCSSG